MDRFLAKLPVDALWGVGPVTAAKLRAVGIEKLVDVRGSDPALLRRTVGSWAETLVGLSHGIDDRPVEPDRPATSCGREETYPRDLLDRRLLRSEAERMAGEVAGWLAKTGLLARTVTLKLRYADFTTITRSDTKRPATREAASIAERASALLARTEAGRRPVRLLGVSVHGLESPEAHDRDTADSQLPLGID